MLTSRDRPYIVRSPSGFPATVTRGFCIPFRVLGYSPKAAAVTEVLEGSALEFVAEDDA